MTRTLFAFLAISLGFAAQADDLAKAYATGSITWPAAPTRSEGPKARDAFFHAWGVVADSKGTVYFSDYNVHRVLRLAPDGSYTTLAGTGTPGRSGDGGPANRAQLLFPTGLAIDSQDNIYISDGGNGRIRKVTPGGVITTIAGGGSQTGEAVAATSALLRSPSAVGVDSKGNLFIAEPDNHRVRKVDAATGLISTFAGSGAAGTLGDDGPALQAQFQYPLSLAVDSADTVYIADINDRRIRKVGADGIVHAYLSIVNLNLPGGYLAFFYPAAIHFAKDGAFYVANNTFSAYGSHVVFRCKDDKCTVAVGSLPTGSAYPHPGYGGDGGPATAAKIADPRGLFTDAEGNLYVSEVRRVRKVSAGTISTVAGSTSGAAAGDGGPVRSASILSPAGAASDGHGNVVVADTDGSRVWRITADGRAEIVAGTGTPGYSGDKGSATDAEIGHPTDVAVDPSGNIFIADRDNLRIRKVTPGGIITTFAGRDFESCGAYNNDNTGAPNMCLLFPQYVSTDKDGNLYVGGDILAYKIQPNGLVNILRPLGGPFEVGDIDVAADGTIYAIGGRNKRQIIRLGKGDIKFTVVAGTGDAGSEGDGGDATVANMAPTSIALDAGGNIFFADSGAQRLRAVSGGTIRTIAGGGQTLGFFGDGGNAADAFVSPVSVAVSDNGRVMFGDQLSFYGMNSLRMVEPANFFTSSVKNTASYQSGLVAPGEFVTIFGVDIGPPDLTIAKTVDGKFPTEFAQTRVLFDGIAAPIYYVWDRQVTVIAPYALAGKDHTEVTIVYQGKTSNKVTLPVVATLPGMFTISATGSGQAAIQHWPDYSVNGKTNPVQPGGVIMVYLTAGGDTGQDGAIATVAQRHPLPVTLSIGGKSADVLYAGSATGMVYGMLQINARVPLDVPSGPAVPIVATVGGQPSQDGTTITVAAPSN